MVKLQFLSYLGDRSDEAGCTSNKPACPPHMFTCVSDQQCIPEYFVCDFEKVSFQQPNNFFYKFLFIMYFNFRIAPMEVTKHLVSSQSVRTMNSLAIINVVFPKNGCAIKKVSLILFIKCKE